MPIILYGYEPIQFTSIPPDGEYFYYIKYAVWGNSTKGEHLVKMKFEKGKFTGFKLYTEKEVKNLKETIFKSDLLFNEFVKKNNLGYINFHVSTDDITFDYFNRSVKGQYFTYLKPHFLGDKSEFRVKLPETDILLEFNVVEKDGVVSYTFKEVTGDLFIPLTNKGALSFEVALNNESINETSFVSFNDEGAQLYKPAPNTLPEGTKIIFYDDIPKVAVYMDGGFTELKPVEFPIKGKKVRTTGIDVPSEYSHISYGQHEVIAGKDAVYFFNHPIDPLPIGGSISYTLGENEHITYSFTGNGFVEGDDISKKEIALTVPVGNAAVPSVTYKYKDEVLIDHELVSFKDNNIYIYEPNGNKLKDGTTIIFHYDVPKVFTYTNGKYIETKPKLLRVLSGETSGLSIIFPEGSEGHNYNQHNFIDGKEGYYFFESVHERLPVGTVIEFYDGGHLVKYKYNGTSFEGQSDTLGKKVAVAVPIINNQNAVYQVKYDGSFANADFIKIENGYFNIYEPDPNVVKNGTAIIISDDVPKMFVYMNGQFNQAKAYKVPAYDADYGGIGIRNNQQYPNFKPYLVEYAMGKDGFYIFDSELAPFYPGFIFEVGFGQTIYGYTFNGSGFVPN